MADIDRDAKGTPTLGEFDGEVIPVKKAGPMAQFLSAKISRKEMVAFKQFMEQHGDETIQLMEPPVSH